MDEDRGVLTYDEISLIVWKMIQNDDFSGFVGGLSFMFNLDVDALKKKMIEFSHHCSRWKGSFEKEHTCIMLSKAIWDIFCGENAVYPVYFTNLLLKLKKEISQMILFFKDIFDKKNIDQMDVALDMNRLKIISRLFIELIIHVNYFEPFILMFACGRPINQLSAKLSVLRHSWSNIIKLSKVFNIKRVIQGICWDTPCVLSFLIFPATNPLFIGGFLPGFREYSNGFNYVDVSSQSYFLIEDCDNKPKIVSPSERTESKFIQVLFSLFFV
ncbi:MAG: hypothetical protein GY714_23155 [Desulfobacterales bacterium]|nr:hypothetical protein [Desulfobacterales bacterium]